MKLRSVLLLYFLLLLPASYAAHDAGAHSPHKIPVQDIIPPIEKPSSIQLAFESPSADWIFTGFVKSEEGEEYHYYLQIFRHLDQIQAVALLVNSQNNQVILFEQSHATIDNQETQPFIWHIGQTFLRFNSINNSWVFGTRSKDKSGFNFKVDMLGKLDGNNTKQQDLRSGSTLLVGQTGSLNGHISLHGNDNFVTAEKAWFRQTWAVNASKKDKSSPLTTIFCDFEDGAGFYAMHLQAHDALRGAVAGWRDAMGSAQPISQFVMAKQSKEGIWQIQVPFPKLQFSLTNALSGQDPDQLSVFAGSIAGKRPGFCSISEHSLV